MNEHHTTEYQLAEMLAEQVGRTFDEMLHWVLNLGIPAWELKCLDRAWSYCESFIHYLD